MVELVVSAYTDLRGVVRFAPLNGPLAYKGGTRRSPFSASWAATVGLLARELRLHGARNAILEIDMAPANIRQDGMPRADRTARSPGVVLSFEAMAVPGRPHLRYEVTEFSHWQDNVRAVALALEALRAVDRYGVTRRGEQYAGWKQLTAGAGEGGDVARGRRLIERAGGNWKRAAALAHPDAGGAENDFKDVIAARDAEQEAA